MIISIEQIKDYLIEINKKEFSDYSSKKLMIDLYESLDTIKVCDTAYPIDWRNSMSEYFKLADIGDWCWGYKPGAAFGIPLPCNERALVLLEILINRDTNSGLIYGPNYHNDMD